MSGDQFRYSRADYALALQNYSEHEQPLPDALRAKLGREYDRVAATWPTASLEAKISHVAMLIGYYVTSGGHENSTHIITYGYEMLCRHSKLSDR
jgi:hypothetical protein